MTALQAIWFILVAVLLTVFAVLDGFDLGVGFWHLGARGDDERRTLLNAIGPVWDGNEVWLLTGGGALFAAFPPVYASVFSGFYLAIVLLALALIVRAVSLEFRSKEESTLWRKVWDVAFSVSSAVAGLLFGVALGNVLGGVPLNDHGDYTGTFLQLLDPYSLFIGVLGLTMLAFHGACFIQLKATGALEQRAHRWAKGAGIAFVVLLLVAMGVTISTQPHLLENLRALPVLWIVPVAALGTVVAAVAFTLKGRPLHAFAGSSGSVVAMMVMSAVGLFPRLLPASNDIALSLTAANSSSSERTLLAMLILALVGLPFVIGYTIWAYRAFSGKVDPAHSSSHY